MPTKIFYFSLAIFSLLFVPAVISANPAPPPQLTEIYEELMGAEKQFESNDWQAARRICAEIYEKFDKIASMLVKDVGITPVEKFQRATDGLQKSLAEKDERLVQRYHIGIQNALLEIMGNYSYKPHPLLTIIRQYLNEDAAKALEKEDYQDVVAEMNEVSSFLLKAKKILADYGVSAEEMTDFDTKVEEVRTAARTRNGNLAGQKLTELNRLYNSFLERGQQQSAFDMKVERSH